MDKEKLLEEHKFLRNLLEKTPSFLDPDGDPPLVWDKDLNFIGHKILKDEQLK
jgi:hypothetical protein